MTDARRDAQTHWEMVFDREFKHESDRASVILAAAVLDVALETVLKARLVSTSGAEDALFDGANAPIATFSARIELAYRLGVIDATFARALHLVRRIRNDFAHNVSGCSFGDSAVLSRLTELCRATAIPERVEPDRRGYPKGPRYDFQLVVSWLQWLLRGQIDRTTPMGQSAALHAEFPVVPPDAVSAGAPSRSAGSSKVPLPARGNAT